MTKPLPLSDVAQSVIEANTDWDVKDIDDVAAASAELDIVAAHLGGHDQAAQALANARVLLRAVLMRNLSAVQSQTFLLAEKHGLAELQVMNGNAREKAAS